MARTVNSKPTSCCPVFRGNYSRTLPLSGSDAEPQGEATLLPPYPPPGGLSVKGNLLSKGHRPGPLPRVWGGGRAGRSGWRVLLLDRPRCTQLVVGNAFVLTFAVCRGSWGHGRLVPVKSWGRCPRPPGGAG